MTFSYEEKLISGRFKPYYRVQKDLPKDKTIGAIVKNFREKIYLPQQEPCAACDGTEFVIISKSGRYRIPHDTSICKSCGLVQTNPRMRKEDYIDYYENHYRALKGQNNPSDAFFESQIERGRDVFNFIDVEKNLSSKNSLVIDVGCGAGGMLVPFQEKGCEIIGLDLNEGFIEYGRKKGLNLVMGTLKDLKPIPKADLIIYSHVMEHISDPNEELKIIKKYLKKNGMLYIAVPGLYHELNNRKRSFMNYLHISHVYHFTLATLSHLLSRHGFKMIKGTEDVCGVFKLDEKAQKQDFTLQKSHKEILKDIKKKERKWLSFELSSSPIRVKRIILEALLELRLLYIVRDLTRLFRKK